MTVRSTAEARARPMQPDQPMERFGALAIAPGPKFFDAHFKFIGCTSDGQDYWNGEPL